jgi:hypothetical protein
MRRRRLRRGRDRVRRRWGTRRWRGSGGLCRCGGIGRHDRRREIGHGVGVSGGRRRRRRRRGRPGWRDSNGSLGGRRERRQGRFGQRRLQHTRPGRAHVAHQYCRRARRHFRTATGPDTQDERQRCCAADQAGRASRDQRRHFQSRPPAARSSTLVCGPLYARHRPARVRSAWRGDTAGLPRRQGTRLYTLCALHQSNCSHGCDTCVRSSADLSHARRSRPRWGRAVTKSAAFSST